MGKTTAVSQSMMNNGLSWQTLPIVNESGLYTILLRSNNPQAKPFRRWVTSEVLPTIRKHGAYMTDKKAQDVLHGNGLADLLIQAGEQIKSLEFDKQQLQVELEEVREKTTYLDLILESPDDKSHRITDIAQYHSIAYYMTCAFNAKLTSNGCFTRNTWAKVTSVVVQETL